MHMVQITLADNTGIARALRARYKENLTMQPVMQIGKYKGEPLADMKTTYLMWLITNDLFRHKRWEFAQVILAELKSRFDDFDKLLTDLEQTDPPTPHWREPAYLDRKAKRKAENLAALEQRRVDEELARLQVVRAKRQLVDASQFVRSQAAFNVSDLV